MIIVLKKEGGGVRLLTCSSEEEIAVRVMVFIFLCDLTSKFTQRVLFWSLMAMVVPWWPVSWWDFLFPHGGLSSGQVVIFITTAESTQSHVSVFGPFSSTTIYLVFHEEKQRQKQLQETTPFRMVEFRESLEIWLSSKSGICSGLVSYEL